MSKFRQKYRIASARRPGWDYRTPGAYFITICTHDRHHFFGSCTQGVMTLSPIGDIVRRFWYEIPQYSPNVELGAFVVMPNHVHGILILTDSPDTDPSDDATRQRDDGMERNVETRQCHVSTPRHDANYHGQNPRNRPTDRRTAPVFIAVFSPTHDRYRPSDAAMPRLYPAPRRQLPRANPAQHVYPRRTIPAPRHQPPRAKPTQHVYPRRTIPAPRRQPSRANPAQ